MADAQGHGGAQYNLGLLHEKGRGVPQDYERAYAWYDLAASRFPPGQDRDKAVEHRDIVAATMTPAQISEAQKLAREWRPKKLGITGGLDDVTTVKLPATNSALIFRSD